MDTRIYDPQTKQFVNLKQDRVLTIGRSLEADIVIPNRDIIPIEDLTVRPYISGIHAFLRFDGKNLIVFDRSRNGTYLRHFDVENSSWEKIRPEYWTIFNPGYELGFGRSVEDGKYVLQVTDEERVNKSLQQFSSRRFVELVRRETPRRA